MYYVFFFKLKLSRKNIDDYSGTAAVQWESFFWLAAVEFTGEWRSVVDNSTITWFNWYQNEPNDYQGILEECAVLFFRGDNVWAWTDIACDRSGSVICKLTSASLV